MKIPEGLCFHCNVLLSNSFASIVSSGLQCQLHPGIPDSALTSLLETGICVGGRDYLTDL